jgi:hypothetical protein
MLLEFSDHGSDEQHDLIDDRVHARRSRLADPGSGRRIHRGAHRRCCASEHPAAVYAGAVHVAADGRDARRRRARIAGLPVFASSPTLPQGIFRLLGPTGGFLMAYPFAAFLTGWLAERGFDRRYFTSIAAMTAGLGLIFLAGVLWFAWFARPVAVGLPNALRLAFYPFIAVDILKIVLAALVLPSVWKFVGPRN